MDQISSIVKRFACRYMLATRASIFLLSCLLLVPCGSLVRADDFAAMRAALNSLDAGELQRYIDFLSDDTLEGREAGSRGGHAAGGYLHRVARHLKLAPAGEGGDYYQPFLGNYRNVLAIHTGNDPELKQQYILVGAHYDHVGYGTSENSFGPVGYIHNGADDNASGCAVMLELAQAVASHGNFLRRSILFAFWDGEEKGLLGSKHWVRNPTVPLENIALVINLDMVGRLGEKGLEVSGTRTASGLRRLVSDQNRDLSLRLDFPWEVPDNSDHFPFFERGIPFLMFHTGLHDDYHRPSDDAHRINAEGSRQISALIFKSLVVLANSDAPPRFRSQARTEGTNDLRRLEQPARPLPSRLGVTWDPAREDGDGVVVRSVLAGSPANSSGIRPDDRILSLNGQKVASGSELREAVRNAPRESEMTLLAAGGVEPRSLPIQLRGEPIRLGISWRRDLGEPNTLVLSRVITDSAAERAGFRVGDRIYRVNGQSPENDAEWREAFAAYPSELKVEVERDGKTQEIIIPQSDSADRLTTF